MIGSGLAVRVVVNGADGHTAATYAGRDAYAEHFGNADTIKEAKAFRLAGRAINSASYTSKGAGHE